MQVINVVEKFVWDKVEEILSNQPDNICKCEKCQVDMVTYALNRLKPNYVSSDKGEVYIRIKAMDANFSATLVVAVTEAIDKVSKNPQHGKEQ